ncbi:hypothetical protein [Streptomyces sp. NPDC003832]
MAVVPVEIENNSGAVVSMALEENGEQLAYFRKLVRAEDLVSVRVVKTPARKPATPAK